MSTVVPTAAATVTPIIAFRKPFIDGNGGKGGSGGGVTLPTAAMAGTD